MRLCIHTQEEVPAASLLIAFCLYFSLEVEITVIRFIPLRPGPDKTSPHNLLAFILVPWACLRLTKHESEHVNF